MKRQTPECDGTMPTSRQSTMNHSTCLFSINYGPKLVLTPRPACPADETDRTKRLENACHFREGSFLPPSRSNSWIKLRFLPVRAVCILRKSKKFRWCVTLISEVCEYGSPNASTCRQNSGRLHLVGMYQWCLSIAAEKSAPRACPRGPCGLRQ
jgi:hypothetical protein